MMMTREFLGISSLGWAVACLAGCFCFFVTLMLTAPSVTDAGLLAASNVKDEGDLAVALRRTSLRSSDAVLGNIDQVTRLDQIYVRVAGWATEVGGPGNPQTMIVFSGGKAYVGRTAGERGDVSKALGLTAASSQNVAFELRIQCNLGDAVLVVALATDGTYGRIRAAQQPNLRCP